MAGSVVAGRHVVALTGDDGTQQQIARLLLDVIEPAPAPALAQPEDGATDVGLQPTFTWKAIAGVDQYRLQVATDSGFGDVVIDVEVGGTDFTPAGELEGGTASLDLSGNGVGEDLFTPTACLELGVCYRLGVSAPAERPATHWDAMFDEELSAGMTKTWMLHIGDSFTDVPRTSLFYSWIETLLHHAVTGGCTATAGCGGGNDCPSNPVSWDQMAVFLAKTFGLTVYGP